MKYLSLPLFFLMTIIFVDIVHASPEKVKFTTYSESPQYFKALIKRLKEGRRTADEDSVDFASVTLAISVYGYAPEQLGSTSEELLVLARKVAIKVLKKSLQKLKDRNLHPDDKVIEINTSKDLMRAYEITLMEIGITEDEFKRVFGD